MSTAALERYIQETPTRLQEVVDRVHGRLLWAVRVQERLLSAQQRGLLEPEEDRMLARCKRYLQQLAKKEMSTYTLTVLAVEGFLPGYGTYEAGIKAFASRTFLAATGKRDFELSRIPSMALREFVPGNLIYANGGRFKIALYHFPIGDRQVEMERYQVDVERERISEVSFTAGITQYNGGSQAAMLQVCPFPMPISRISRASVTRSRTASRCQWQSWVISNKIIVVARCTTISGKEIQHRFGQHVRLANVGPADRVKRGDLGYPICSICGAVRSPYASDMELTHFKQVHQERCGKAPEELAVTTDGRVDGILFQGLADRAAAVNLGEALRIGATQLWRWRPRTCNCSHYHSLMTPTISSSMIPCQAVLGYYINCLSNGRAFLLAATQNLSTCENKCQRSCYNCMRTYRNIFYHDLLDRHEAVKLIEEYQSTPKQERELTPVEGAMASTSAGSQPIVAKKR